MTAPTTTPVYRERLTTLRNAFPAPVSDKMHDAYFVFSIMRALDQVDAMKSEVPMLGHSQALDYAAAEQAEVQMVWGIPRWVFFGWVIPLLVANVFTIWFCLCKMQDEPMEELPEDKP